MKAEKNLSTPSLVTVFGNTELLSVQKKTVLALNSGLYGDGPENEHTMIGSSFIHSFFLHLFKTSSSIQGKLVLFCSYLHYATRRLLAKGLVGSTAP